MTEKIKDGSVRKDNIFSRFINWIRDDSQKKRLISFLNYLFLYVPFIGIPGCFWGFFVLFKLLDGDVSGTEKIFYFVGLVPGILLICVPGFLIIYKLGKPFDKFLSMVFNYNEDGSVEE